MFVTVPAFEQFVPPGLKLPEQRFWIAASLSLNSPWYLFTYELERGTEVTRHTALAAWETALAELLRSVPFKNRKAVARFDPPQEGSPANWTMKLVDTVWVTSAFERDMGPLVFQLQGEAVVRDSFLEPVALDAKRELIFRCSP